MKGPSIPATGDTLNETNKGYNEAATDFAIRFNKQMVNRKNSKPKTQLGRAKELSLRELTLGGVTIGKSNLYNAVGFFGTNMFKQETSGGETVSVICWKGGDGTTLAFESGQAGGPDLKVTSIRLIGEGSKYQYAADCKSSKKVSSSIELAGLKLGDSASEAEKKRGDPSDRGTNVIKWQTVHASKKRSVATDVEVALVEEKLASVSVSQVEEK